MAWERNIMRKVRVRNSQKKGVLGKLLTAVAEAGGHVRIGPSSFECPHEATPGSAVKVYLRPEDILARPISPGDSNVFDATLDKVEFLGSYCLVRVTSPALGDQRLTVYLSLNFLAEQALEAGGRLPLRLVPERMRLFAA